MFYNAAAVEFFSRIPSLFGREPSETVVVAFLRDERLSAVVELSAEDSMPETICYRIQDIAAAVGADAVTMAAVAARRAATAISAIDHATRELPQSGISVLAAVHVFDLRPGGIWSDITAHHGGVIGRA